MLKARRRLKNSTVLQDSPKECELGRDVFGKAPSVTSHPGPTASRVSDHFLRGPLSCSHCSAERCGPAHQSPAFPVPHGPSGGPDLCLEGCGQGPATCLIYRFWTSSRFPDQTVVDSGLWNHQARASLDLLRELVLREAAHSRQWACWEGVSLNPTQTVAS